MKHQAGRIGFWRRLFLSWPSVACSRQVQTWPRIQPIWTFQPRAARRLNWSHSFPPLPNMILVHRKVGLWKILRGPRGSRGHHAGVVLCHVQAETLRRWHFNGRDLLVDLAANWNCRMFARVEAHGAICRSRLRLILCPWSPSWFS